jgi:hypothetical protein
MSGNPTNQELATVAMAWTKAVSVASSPPFFRATLSHFYATHHLAKVAKTNQCLYTAAT